MSKNIFSRKRAIVFGTALAVLMLLAGGAYGLFGRSGGAAPFALRPDDPAVVTRGLAVYAQQCARCHGADLAGQPNWRQRGPDGLLPAPPHNRNGHTWHHPDAVLFKLTKYGVQQYAGADYKSAMPAYGSVLSDQDIVAVLSYIKATWPPDVRQMHDQLEASQQR
jgi:mono/diheme cytochrome c family protein